MVAIIDYGLGNAGSISNMLKAIGERNVVTGSVETIRNADKMILPGVGTFDAGMRNLERRGLIDIIREQTMEYGRPLLGICLGMQLLGRESEEGDSEGLGFIPMVCRKFRQDGQNSLKIPHMGWDVVDFCKEHSLVDGLQNRQRYYFVHSYYAVCAEEKDVLMSCDYGHDFPAAVARGNIMGVQFHPEKSHDFGMALLRNFVKKC